MLTTHIQPGKLVRIKTIGSSSINIAPPLEFIGILKDESQQNFSGGAGGGCVRITYDGSIAQQNSEGKVLGFKKGSKVMTIPNRVIKSVEPLNTVGY